METKVSSKRLKMSSSRKALPVVQEPCSFEGYDVELLMSETGKLRELITKRGTLEITTMLYHRSS
jgi:hypothetical protein